MKIISLCLALLFSVTAFAKLPAPSDEAKLKALEAKQKSAHGDKVGAYKLCLSQDKVAEKYRKGKKDVPAAPATPKCEDPGAFVFVPPEVAPAAAAAPPVAAPAGSPVAAAPAAPPTPAKK